MIVVLANGEELITALFDILNLISKYKIIIKS